MKRLFAFLLMLLMGVGSAWAVGTCTVSNVTSTQIAAESNRIPDAETVIVTLTCTADSATGSYPSTTIPLTGYYPASYLNTYNLTGFFLYQVGQTPGSTAPTANYTVTIKDTKGFALDLGLLTSNGSASAAQMTSIANATTNYPVVRSGLTVAITGNSVNSAQITLDLIFRAASLSAGVSSGGGGAGTVTHTAGALTLNAAMFGNGTADSKVDTSITTDGSGNLTAVTVTAGSAILGTASAAAKAALPAGANGAALDESSTAGVPAVAVDYIRADSTAHRLKQSLNNGAEVNIPIPSEIPAAQVAANLANSSATGVTGILPSTQVSPVPVPTPGSSITLAGPSGFAICTTTCTVAVPVPVAGYQFCIMNDDNVSTAITLSALGSSARYENSARTAYGTAGTGTLVVAAAAADMVCIVGRDSTHYFTTNFSGTVTVN